MPNFGPSLALAVPIPEGLKELTPYRWKELMKDRLREMQKQYPQNLLADEWLDRTGEPAILRDWGDLMDSPVLRTMLMERGQWPEETMTIDPEELIPDDEMLTDPIDLVAYLA